MSKPRYKWWGYIKNVIRDYPRLKQEYEALHEQSVTPSMSGMPGGGGASRAVENLAIRELPKAEQRDYEAVQKAIDGTQRLETGEDRLKLVRLVFWKNQKLKDAAYKCHVSYDTACNYHWEFIMLVAYHKDLLTYTELRKAFKSAKTADGGTV